MQLAFIAVSHAQTIRYVKATAAGNGDGSSWANASDDIQAMINASVANDQVWVAGGTYLPNRKANALTVITPNNRDNAFVLKADVKIYGGFAGTETALSQRDLTLTANESILSGDLGIAVDNSDNAYHVIISAGAVGTAELNGFTIKGGNANVFPGTVTVNSNTVYRNSGGGIYNFNSSPKISNVSLNGNSANNKGGGICNFNSSALIITNVTFSGNSANNDGGGIFNDFSSPFITNVTLNGNSANNGGGIYNVSSSPVITNVTLSGNSADGGGIYNFDSSPVIRNSIIYGNSSGIFNDYSTPVISYSMVQGSTDTSNGNISETDPLFVDAPLFGTAPFIGGDYRL
ncbi:MAG TPA: right-handed parallel beta-helix repeat-containing protein [Pelobium sp.]|nr:right-handed parallel beta-helix repeat-containing protein [Pelobium sp.]